MTVLNNARIAEVTDGSIREGAVVVEEGQIHSVEGSTRASKNDAIRQRCGL